MWRMIEAQYEGDVAQIHRRNAARLAARARSYLVDAEKACWELERVSLHPRTTDVELGSAAREINRHLNEADRLLALARTEDRDGLVSPEISLVEQERERIGTLREGLIDDRVRQGLRRDADIDVWLKDIAGVLDEGDVDLRPSNSDLQDPFGPQIIVSDFRLCFRFLKDYRRVEHDGSATTNSHFFQAVDHVLDLSSKLETLAARPFVLRERKLELRSHLKTIERCGRWLLAHRPKGEPDWSSVPENEAPAEPTGPGVKQSQVMRDLRALRNERARAAKDQLKS